MNVAVKSTILFSRAVVASVNSSSIGLVRSRTQLSLAKCVHLLKHRFLLQKRVKLRLGSWVIVMYIGENV